MFSVKFLLALLPFLIGKISPSIVEGSINLTNEENVCDFDDRHLAESVRFLRSIYSCRVYHVCAFYKQYTLTCAEGLYFDENLDSCNFQNLVPCKLADELNQAENNIIQTNITETLFSESIYHQIQNASNFNFNIRPETSPQPNLEFESTYLTEAIQIKTTNPITNFNPTTTPINTPMLSTTTTNTSPITLISLLFSTSTFNKPLIEESNNNLSTETTKSTTTEKTSTSTTAPTTSPTTTTSTTTSTAPTTVTTTTTRTSTIINSQISNNNNNNTQNFKIEGCNSTLLVEITSVISATNLTNSKTNSTSSVPTINIPLVYNENTDLNNSWWLGPTDCVKGFDHKIPNQNNCALYFECKKNGERIEKACPYPLQYDNLLHECRSYDLVECGSRAQAKDLCDYELSNSESNLIPCDVYPSCKLLSDGLYPSNDCRHYYQCKDERTLRILSCPKDKKTGAQMRFNFLTKRCDEVENVSFNCGGYSIPIDIYTNKMVCPAQDLMRFSNDQLLMETRDLYFSHPQECNIYIGCDQYGNMTELECLNGTHFSPYYQSCVHPSVANCKKYPTIDETPLKLSLKYLFLDKGYKPVYIEETQVQDVEQPKLNEINENFNNTSNLH